MGWSRVDGDVLICYCMIFILLCILAWIWQKEKGNRFPGPGHFIFGRLTNVLALRDMKTFMHVMENWCRKYGPVFTFKFGPYNVTVLNSAENVQKLLGSKDMAHNPKGFMYEPFKPFWFDGLGISKGDKWKSRRKVMDKHVFSFGTLRNYIKIFSEEGDKLVQALGTVFPEKNGETEEKVIEEVLKTATFNVVTNAVLGKKYVPDFEQMDKESGMRYTDALDKIKDVVATRSLSPWLLLNPLWRLHPMSKVEDLVVKMSSNYVTKNIIDDDKTKSNVGIKHSLLEAGVTIDGVVEEALALINAGYDTTASSLHFLLFFLALHPHHQEICRDEVDAMFEDVDLCPAGNIEFKALNKMKHLEMCVLETLRLLPTVFIMMRKIDAPLKLENDIEIPSGSQVAIFVPGLHKNPEYFPEPDKFIPERFSSEKSKDRHSFAYIPFSEGGRKCVGYKFAMWEMMILTAKILRHYVISTQDKFEHVEFLPLVTLTPDRPIRFNFRRRLQKHVG